jgi:hypothetical protein
MRPPRYQPVTDTDLGDALRVLRRGFGPDQVTVLTITRHDDPAELELVHRLFELAPAADDDLEE